MPAHDQATTRHPAWFTALATRWQGKRTAPAYHQRGTRHFVTPTAIDPPPARILVVKLFALGDMINITPALRALRERYPAATITVLANQGGAAGLQRSPYIDDVLIFDKSLFDQVGGIFSPRALLAGVRFALTLRRRQYDTLVLLHHLVTAWGTCKYLILALWSGARVRVGLDNGRGWFLTHRVRDDGFGKISERQYWLKVVAAIGAASDNDRPVFTVTAADCAAAQHLLAAHPSKQHGPLVAIHPTNGTYAPGRQWPAAQFAAVADRLAATQQARIVLVGVEVDAINKVAALIQAPILNLAGQTDLPTLAGVLSQSDLLLGNDSSVAHLAAALGTPTLAIFGPSNDAAWLPWGASTIRLPPPGEPLPPLPQTTALAVRSANPHAPCLYTGFGPGNPNSCPNCRCLAQVDVASITLLAQHLLAQPQVSSLPQ